MNISLKEARETFYWLRVIKLSKLLAENIVDKELDECNQIVAILTASVKSIKNRIRA